MQLKRAQEFILKKLKNELAGHLTYHNIDHTLDVFNAAGNIADAEEVSAYEKKLLLTAALFHDSGFLKKRDGHETESCNIARQHLPGFNYSPDEIDLICSMIMTTRIPQSAATHLEKILCDADLDYLGRSDFLVLSEKLFLELCSEGLIRDEYHWDTEQVKFMEAHNYYTAASNAARLAKERENINLVKSKL